MFHFTYTDTFGGEPNFSWAECGDIACANNIKHALRLARKQMGLTGVKGRITANYGDEIHWQPRGFHRIIMVSVKY